MIRSLLRLMPPRLSNKNGDTQKGIAVDYVHFRLEIMAMALW